MNAPFITSFRKSSGASRIGIASSRTALLVVICIVLIGSAVNAQNNASLPPANTSSPRDTLKTFIDYCNAFYERTEADRHFDRRSPHQRPLVRGALDCLDTSELPDYARQDLAAEAAACLKEIIDRTELPPFAEIPDVAAIEAAGGPEQLSRWHIPGTRISIARVEEGPQKHEYLFTPGTVERAFDRYEEIEQLDYRTTGPEVSKGFYRWYSSAPGHPTIAVIVDRLPEWISRYWPLHWPTVLSDCWPFAGARNQCCFTG
jgi:MscS family membrane protein